MVNIGPTNSDLTSRAKQSFVYSVLSGVFQKPNATIDEKYDYPRQYAVDPVEDALSALPVLGNHYAKLFKLYPNLRIQNEEEFAQQIVPYLDLKQQVLAKFCDSGNSSGEEDLSKVTSTLIDETKRKDKVVDTK